MCHTGFDMILDLVKIMPVYGGASASITVSIGTSGTSLTLDPDNTGAIDSNPVLATIKNEMKAAAELQYKQYRRRVVFAVMASMSESSTPSGQPDEPPIITYTVVFDIYRMWSDGTDIEKINTITTGSEQISLSVLPGGNEYLALVYNNNNGYKTSRYSCTASNPGTSVDPLDGFSEIFGYSPDEGSNIVAASKREGPPDSENIYYVDMDSSANVKVASLGTEFGLNGASWGKNKDGVTVLYYANNKFMEQKDDVESYISVIEKTGGVYNSSHILETALGTGTYKMYPAWSNDKKLAYITEVHDSNDEFMGMYLYVIDCNSEGNQPVKISTPDIEPIFPVWTPDGRIIFAAALGSYESGDDEGEENHPKGDSKYPQCAIFSVNPNGSGLTKLVSEQDISSLPMKGMSIQP